MIVVVALALDRPFILSPSQDNDSFAMVTSIIISCTVYLTENRQMR